jgi:hypothetical protein
MCTRVRVTNEKDLFEAVDGLLQAVPYPGTIDTIPAYLAEYPHDQYSELFFISGEIFEQQVSSLSLLKAHTRQMIYMRNWHEEELPDVSAEILQQYQEAGVELWPVDIGNVKRDMEQLSLG